MNDSTKTIKNTTSKPLLKSVGIACSIAIITGCNTIPSKTDATKSVLAQPQIPITKPYQFTAYDNKTSSTADSSSIASQRWQEFYQDDKLKSLIQLALINNKDLQNALLSIQEAKAQYQITDISNVANLTGSGGYTRSASISDKNPRSAYNVGLAMSGYEIDFWGKIANSKEQALQSYLATTAGKDTAQISLISNIAQAYVNLSYAYAQKQLALATVATRQKSLAITKARFNAGIDSKSPSLQAESSLETAKLAVYEADTSIGQLQNALRLLVGSDIPEQLLPTPAVTNITTHKIFSAGLPSELLLYRPDILQAEYNLKAAGANIQVARANYFPSIGLTGNAGLTSTQFSDLFKSSAFGWSFGPSISVPIFDAGKLDANYQVSKIQQQQALNTYESSIQTAFREVSDVLATRATLEERLESQYKLQSSYQQTYDISNARYKAGLDNYLSVLDAERSTFSTQQSIYNLEQAKVISQIQLYEALGGGVDLDTPILLKMPNQNTLVSFTDTDTNTNESLANATSQTTVGHQSSAKVLSEQAAIEYIDQH